MSVKKINPKKIFLCQLEGPGSYESYELMIDREPVKDEHEKLVTLECLKFAETNSWRESDSKLYAWSAYAPKDGSYFKTDFVVAFEDNLLYRGRYDLQHPSINDPNLREHVKDFSQFYSGLHKPSFMDNEQYEDLMLEFSEKEKNYFRNILDNYSLE